MDNYDHKFTIMILYWLCIVLLWWDFTTIVNENNTQELLATPLTNSGLVAKVKDTWHCTVVSG